MDDFRVGSVTSPDPYGNRRPVDPNTRRRQRHHDEGNSGEEEPQDTIELAEADIPADGEQIEDYYVPSETVEDAE